MAEHMREDGISVVSRWRITKEWCLPLFKDLLIAGFEICVKSRDMIVETTVQSQSIAFHRNFVDLISTRVTQLIEKACFFNYKMLSCHYMWVLRATVATFTLTWANRQATVTAWVNGEAAVTAVSEPVMWPLHWTLYPHDKRSTWWNQTKHFTVFPEL